MLLQGAPPGFPERLAPDAIPADVLEAIKKSSGPHLPASALQHYNRLLESPAAPALPSADLAGVFPRSLPQQLAPLASELAQAPRTMMFNGTQQLHAILASERQHARPQVISFPLDAHSQPVFRLVTQLQHPKWRMTVTFGTTSQLSGEFFKTMIKRSSL